MKPLTAKRLALIPLLALILAATSPLASADGYIITEVVDPSSVMSDQKAVLIHRNGHEDLIISVGLALQPEQDREDWAWLIPVPARPEVRATEHAIFAELDLISLPEIIWQAVDEQEVGAGLDSGDMAAVEVLERKQVGVLDVAILGGDQAGTLLAWLEEEGFHLPQALVDPVDAYIAEGWTFVAMRISPYASDYEIQDAQPVWLSFDAPAMVYPMRLTGAHGSNLGLRLYILADHRTQLDGFQVEFAGHARLEPADPELAAVLDGEFFFTKLHNPAVTPQEMAVDFYPTRAAADELYRRTEVRTYVDTGKYEPSDGILALWPCGLCWLALVLLLILLLVTIYLLKRRPPSSS